MVAIKPLICLILLLTGCSQTQPQRIDMTDNIQSCMVYPMYIECKMEDGNTWFAYTTKINEVTKWDKSLWKK